MPLHPAGSTRLVDAGLLVQGFLEGVSGGNRTYSIATKRMISEIVLN